MSGFIIVKAVSMLLLQGFGVQSADGEGKKKKNSNQYKINTKTRLRMQLLGNKLVFLTLLLCLIFKIKKKLFYK